jgi:hypothetical protein
MAAFCIVASFMWVLACVAIVLFAADHPSPKAAYMLLFIFVLSASICASEDRICAAADEQCMEGAP